MLAYVYMHDMGWGWGMLMTLGWLVLLGLFAGVLTAGVRDRRGPSPREILDRRLAAGEIDLDDYRRARDAMSNSGRGRPPANPSAPA
jgi:putative membrane protein